LGYIESQNTLTQMQNNTNRVQYEQGRQNLGGTSLGKDAFLRLLLAQLQHQDPTDPVSDKEFIAQQAQFTQIEKLDELNANLSKSNQIAQASSMVGKTVEIQRSDGSKFTGRIDSVQIDNQGVGLRIGDETYTPNQIIQIFAPQA
jgi:flagellar basal-body rod modification protein FlgD